MDGTIFTASVEAPMATLASSLTAIDDVSLSDRGRRLQADVVRRETADESDESRVQKINPGHSSVRRRAEEGITRISLLAAAAG